MSEIGGTGPLPPPKIDRSVPPPPVAEVVPPPGVGGSDGANLGQTEVPDISAGVVPPPDRGRDGTDGVSQGQVDVLPVLGDDRNEPLPAVIETGNEPRNVSGTGEEEPLASEARQLTSGDEESPESGKVKLVMVDVSDAVKSQAVDRAEDKLTADAAEMKGAKGIFQRIWKHNLLREYYRQREIGKAKKEILASGNIFAGETDNLDAHNQAVGAVIDRFASEHEEAIHKMGKNGKEGEEKVVLGERPADKERDDYLKKGITDLIKQLATGQIDEDSFTEGKNRLFSSITGLGEKGSRGERMWADNMLEMAKGMKDQVEHGKRVEELNMDFDVVLGRAKMGVRTEAQFNLVDRLTARICQTKLGSLVSETTVATALSVAYTLGVRASESFLKSNVAKVASYGGTAVASGLIAGAKEGMRIEEERKKHFRDMAKSKTFNPDIDKRRVEMERYRYQTVKSADLIAGLSLAGEGELTAEQIQTLTQNYVEADARVKLSDRSKIDMIAYSSGKNVEDERWQLDIARAEARVRLERALAGGSNLNGQTSGEHLKSLVETRVKMLVEGNSGVEQKNRMFNKMKTKRVAVAVVKGVVTGVVIGGLVQEGMALVRDDQQGIIESLIKGENPAARNFTPLEYLRRQLEGKLPGVNKFFDHTETIGKNTFNLPKGVDFTQNPDGTYQLIRGREVLGNGIAVDADGNFTAASKQILQSKGMLVDQVAQTHSHVSTVTSQETIKQSVAEYVRGKTDQFKQIGRNIWYDNDTPGNFDKNELKLWWGGGGNTGITKDGDFTFTVKQMMENGSYHNGLAVNAQKAIAEGKLKLLLTLSEDTQKMAVELPVDSSGNIIIDQHSEIAKLFFQDVGGKAKFLGRYAEVAEYLGKGANGEDRFNLLATAVGDGVKGELEKTVEKVQEVTTFDTLFNTSVAVPENYYWEPPLIIPLFGRRPLERARTPEPREPEVPRTPETPPAEIGGLPALVKPAGVPEVVSRPLEVIHPFTPVPEIGGPLQIDDEGPGDTTRPPELSPWGEMVELNGGKKPLQISDEGPGDTTRPPEASPWNDELVESQNLPEKIEIPGVAIDKPMRDILTNVREQMMAADLRDPVALEKLRVMMETAFNGYDTNRGVSNPLQVLAMLGVGSQLRDGRILVTDITTLAKEVSQRRGDEKIGRGNRAIHLGPPEAKASPEMTKDTAVDLGKLEKFEEWRLPQFSVDSSMPPSREVYGGRWELHPDTLVLNNRRIRTGYVLGVDNGPIPPDADDFYSSSVVGRLDLAVEVEERAIGNAWPKEWIAADVALSQSGEAQRLGEKLVLPVHHEIREGELVRIYPPAGIDMGSYLANRGSMSEKNATSLALRVADDLAELEKYQLIHTNLDDTKVMLNGGIRLTGLDYTSYSQDGQVFQYGLADGVGNNFTRPPELFTFGATFGKTVHVYEAGALLYKALTGNWPYDIEGNKQLTPEQKRQGYAKLHQAGKMTYPDGFNQDLRRIIERAMAPKPEYRYASVEEMKVDLMEAYGKMI